LLIKLLQVSIHLKFLCIVHHVYCKIGAARCCQILRLKCTKFDFHCGSAPPSHPTGRPYSAPPGPLAVFNGPTSKGRVRKGEEEEGKREGKKGLKSRKEGRAASFQLGVWIQQWRKQRMEKGKKRS